MTRTTSPNYHLNVFARFGGLTVVDIEHHLAGRPVGSDKITRLDPALIGKAIREHAVATPSFTTDAFRHAVKGLDDLLMTAVGAPNWGNLQHTSAKLRVSSDGNETRFWCMAPSKLRGFDYTQSMYVDTKLSNRVPLPDYPRVGGRDPLLIAPWRDPEMLGHAVLTMFRLCRPPFGNDVKESVLDPPDGKRRTALHRAALAGDLDEMPPTGRRTRRKLDAQDTLGTTPLMLAAQAGHACVVERLLGLGAQPDFVDNEGRSALHHASMAGRTKAARLLLDAGGTPNLVDSYAETPPARGCREGIRRGRTATTRGASRLRP